MTIDWTDAELRHRLSVVQVVPGDLGKTYPGTVEVSDGAASITTGYYVDARVSASLSITDPEDLVENAWVRLMHTIDGTDYSQELGTFVVADIKPSFKAGGRVFDLDLRSPLWAMSQDMNSGPFVIGNGAKLSDVLRTEMGWARMAYSTSGILDYRWRGTLALEACKTRLSWLFDTLKPTGNRLDVDGHGRITVRQYTSPTNRTPSMLIDCADPKSVIVADSVTWSGNRASRVNKAVVKATSPKGGEWRGEAKAPASATYSTERRGWTKATTYDVQDLGAPYTWAHAGQLAAKHLAEDSASEASWTLETAAWLPISAGDVIDFAPRDADPWGDGAARKCLVKDCEQDCSKWTLKLTLKEV